MENIDMSSVQLITDSYQNYHRSVYLYILYKIGKDEDAKDLAQDVFLRLMDYKQMLRPETIKYFIFSICRNLVIDYLRRHYKMQEITSYFLEESSPAACATKKDLCNESLQAYIVSGYFRLSRIICPYCRKSFVYQSERNP